MPKPLSCSLAYAAETGPAPSAAVFSTAASTLGVSSAVSSIQQTVQHLVLRQALSTTCITIIASTTMVFSAASSIQQCVQHSGTRQALSNHGEHSVPCPAFTTTSSIQYGNIQYPALQYSVQYPVMQHYIQHPAMHPAPILVIPNM